MNYHKILKDDMLNGEGLRVVVFLSGCEHKCKGCHNPETWDADSGKPFGVLEFQEIISQLKKEYISGITLTGGDPLHPKNLQNATELCMLINEIFPEKTIWIYTGYDFKDIENFEILQYIDVLIDGKYKEECSDSKYEWAGSTNQKIIKIKKASNKT